MRSRCAADVLCPHQVQALILSHAHAGRASNRRHQAHACRRGSTDARSPHGRRRQRPVRTPSPLSPVREVVLTFLPLCSTSESPCKRDALFFLANATFRVYFALSNLRLCDTVLNNTQNSAARLESFPKGDRCAFLYYRGRIALYQRRLPQARNDLRRAFALCSAASWRNGRCVSHSPSKHATATRLTVFPRSLILTYLVAASLPLGFFPSLPLLQHFNLHEQYASLLQSLKVRPSLLAPRALTTSGR